MADFDYQVGDVGGIRNLQGLAGQEFPARLQRNIDTMTSVFKIAEKPKAEEVYIGTFVPPQSERMLRF